MPLSGPAAVALSPERTGLPADFRGAWRGSASFCIEGKLCTLYKAHNIEATPPLVILTGAEVTPSLL